MDKSINNETIVQKILAVDSSHREIGVTGDTHTLDTLETKSYDFSYPTLVPNEDSSAYGTSRIRNMKEFLEQWHKQYPTLIYTDVDWSKILAAGSSPGQFIRTNFKWHASDVDFFIHSCKDTIEATDTALKLAVALVQGAQLKSREELKQKIKKEAEAIAEPDNIKKQERIKVAQKVLKDYNYFVFVRKEGYMVPSTIGSNKPAKLKYIQDVLGFKLEYRLARCVATRTKNSLTLVIEKPRYGHWKFQIIFRLYSSPSEILHGFDLGSSAVGFNGKDVIFTTLGRFAYEYGYNIIDTTRRSTTYEARLRKYFDRGFHIILPNLKLDSLSRKNLRYSYKEVAPLPYLPFAYSNIIGNRIIVAKIFRRENETTSDYDIEDEYMIGFKIALLNLRTLVRRGTNLIHFEEGMGVRVVQNVFHKPPHLTVQMIQGLYDRFRISSWSEGRLKTRTLESYISVTNLGTIIREMFPINETGMPRAKYEKHASEVINRIFTQQRKESVNAFKKYVETKDHSLIPWITKNPGTQLTGSINPIFDKPETWYGPMHYTV